MMTPKRPRLLPFLVCVIVLFIVIALSSLSSGEGFRFSEVFKSGELTTGDYSPPQLPERIAQTKAIKLYYRLVDGWYWYDPICDYMCVKEYAKFIITADYVIHNAKYFNYLMQLDPDSLYEQPPQSEDETYEPIVLVELVDKQGLVVFWYAIGGGYDVMLVNGKRVLNDKNYYDLILQLLPAAEVDRFREAITSNKLNDAGT